LVCDICETLHSVLPKNDDTGQGSFDILTEIKCLSDRIYGAGSFHGQYNCLQGKSADVADEHLHILDYEHVLNLVITEITKYCFSNFYETSWIRVVARKHIGQEKMK